MLRQLSLKGVTLTKPVYGGGAMLRQLSLKGVTLTKPVYGGGAMLRQLSLKGLNLRIKLFNLALQRLHVVLQVQTNTLNYYPTYQNPCSQFSQQCFGSGSRFRGLLDPDPDSESGSRGFNKFILFYDDVNKQIGSGFWVLWLRFEIFGWIRIRIQLNTDPKHCFTVYTNLRLSLNYLMLQYTLI